MGWIGNGIPRKIIKTARKLYSQILFLLFYLCINFNFLYAENFGTEGNCFETGKVSLNAAAWLMSLYVTSRFATKSFLESQPRKYFILFYLAGSEEGCKMKRIRCSDWLPERVRGPNESAYDNKNLFLLPRLFIRDSLDP